MARAALYLADVGKPHDAGLQRHGHRTRAARQPRETYKTMHLTAARVMDTRSHGVLAGTLVRLVVPGLRDDVEGGHIDLTGNRDSSTIPVIANCCVPMALAGHGCQPDTTKLVSRYECLVPCSRSHFAWQAVAALAASIC